MNSDFDYSRAIDDFRRARNQASLRELLGRLRGESTRLLSFDEVKQKLKLRASVERGLRDVPLDAIVGSVGRYNDFTRDFLPKEAVAADRWARVKTVANGMEGLPPIEVYQVGEVYFVKDGNHRVSVARQMGASHIQAYVTEVQSRVPLTPEIQPDDLILKAEYADFLDFTQFNLLRPDADLSVSVPGRYQDLLEHIEVHRYFMGLDYQREIPYQEAAAHWYDEVYLPVVQAIRSLGILRDFPDRTEADLYLWIADHRAQMEEELGWEIQTGHIASHLLSEHAPKSGGLFGRLGSRLLDIVIPESLETGPPPGEWRAQVEAVHPSDCLFIEILVPVNGQEEGWNALEQAFLLGGREGASLQGLYVVPTAAEQEQKKALSVKKEFNRRCERAGVSGDLLITSGKVAQRICEHAAWSDVIVANLAHPPGEQPLERLGSGFRQLIQRCPRPVLATPGKVSPLERPILAYEGSPKSREGLYIAAYLAGKWEVPLVVVSVSDDKRIGEEILSEAREYLDRCEVTATYLIKSGQVAVSILGAGDTYGCDFYILGGYGLDPVLEVMLGSTVDHVLRQSKLPVLICR